MACEGLGAPGWLAGEERVIVSVVGVVVVHVVVFSGRQVYIVGVCLGDPHAYHGMREGKLPLRTILENFINHVDTLEAKRSEGNDQYEVEFQELKQLTESLRGRSDFSCTQGEKDVNRRKNRYKDILPYDYSRVVLSCFPGVPGSDYINANFIRGASGSRAYIGSQGPLAHTVPDFWRMVVECEVQVIIMASNETEGGKHKCECYWVNNQNEERQFGTVSVSFVKARQVCPDFMVRTLKIKYTTDAGTTEERTICQFHYVLWPDHGVPETVRPLLDMVRLVRDCQASETLPVLVHCSAGCGRTGTICAIDYVWGLLRAGRLSENLDLFGLVKEMRRQRVAMVQTREQYILLHRAVRELFKERLKVIDAHPYENIATDGTPLILREKESDYEELYMRPEKQDESAKVTPPSTITTGNITCNTHPQDKQPTVSPGTHSSSSAAVLALQLKLIKTQPLSHGSLSPHSQSFPGPHTSPPPQPSPLSPPPCPRPALCPPRPLTRHTSALWDHQWPRPWGVPPSRAWCQALSAWPSARSERKKQKT
ncbi:tyrosine-protein phosphatase non-receptor type 12-like isoform X2 [Scylla paramamosain]|uniref:tyrosine-protein phosphatase non-receptor type 12-like isoform X2 n=1 Tax=Scylla paramamosain TaxID=85552 RepID=UPI0030836EE6